MLITYVASHAHLTPGLRQETFVSMPSEVSSPSPGEQTEEELEEECEPESLLKTPSKESLDPDPQCLLTNGKLPLWAKRLLGDDDVADGSALHMKRSYQPHGRWAERADQKPLKTILDAQDLDCYFTPMKPESLHDSILDTVEPQNLAGLLSEPESPQERDLSQANERVTYPPEETISVTGREAKGTPRNQPSDSYIKASFVDFRDQSLPEDSGESEAELECNLECSFTTIHSSPTLLDPDPHFHTMMPPNSGTIEEPSRPEVPSLASSSLPQTPEQEKFLRQHFETLTDAHPKELFSGSLQDEPCDPEDFFFNPRLSISTQFLSGLQKTSTFSHIIPSRLPLQLMKSPNVQLPDHGRGQPKAEPPKASPACISMSSGAKAEELPESLETGCPLTPSLLGPMPGVPSSVPPRDWKPLAPTAGPTSSMAQSAYTPPTCFSAEAKISHSTSPEDREPPMLPELISPTQEHGSPTTVAPDSDIEGRELPRRSWGNHEARASLKLTLPGICDGPLLPSPPMEPQPTCSWSSEPVDTQPSVTVTETHLPASNPVDGSALRLPSSTFLPGLLTPEPLHFPACPSSPVPPGSLTSLEPTPGMLCSIPANPEHCGEFPSPTEPRSVGAIVHRLQTAFQDALALYHQVAPRDQDCTTEQQQTRAELTSTFLWIQSQLEAHDGLVKTNASPAQLPSSQVSPSPPMLCPLASPDLHALLEHYSELLVQAVRKKVRGD